MEDFRRARQPDQVQVRRATLLKAAVELFDAQGANGAGLNAIAARAGFTKSNVYRYFESREHVLLELFLDEYARLTEGITSILEGGVEDSVDYAADAIASAFIAQPRCCSLMTMFSAVLEQNVTAATVETVKRAILKHNRTIVTAMARQLPRSSEEDRGWALAMTLSLLAGMWPGAHPAPAAAAVMAKPEFAGMALDPRRDLTRAVRALLSAI